MGCGYHTWKKNNKKTNYLMICNYAPSYNLSQLYAVGKHCTKCPEDTSCSLMYTGLCDSGVEKWRAARLFYKQSIVLIFFLLGFFITFY